MPYNQYDPERNNRINKIMQEKTEKALVSLKFQMIKLGMEHNESDPLTNLNKRFSKNDGMINRIRFKFKRSGVFVHKGVGRGTKASQVGNNNRKAKEWFTPVIERYADEIVEECADEWVDIIFNHLKIK